MRVRRGRGVKVGLWTGGILVVLIVASQLLLPVVAVHVLRGRVGKYGPVQSAHIHAVPAIELLWGHAQSASVHTGALHMSVEQGVELLKEASGVDTVQASSSSVQAGPWQLSDVQMAKHGSSVQMQATVTAAGLRAALPGDVQVQGIGVGQEGQPEVTVGGELFGVSATVVAVVTPSQGELVAEPRGLLSLGGLARITLFSDPHLQVQTFTLTPLPGDASWRLQLGATVN
jgi:hypothetical protein